jgi:hypothetical protein
VDWKDYGSGEGEEMGDDEIEFIDGFVVDGGIDCEVVTR